MVKFEEVLGGKEYYWRCTKCNSPAITEHDNPECHTCKDWSHIDH